MRRLRRRTDPPVDRVSTSGTRREEGKTHKYQGGVEVFIVSLYELPIIFLRIVAVQLVELGSVIFFSLQRVLFLTAQVFNA